MSANANRQQPISAPTLLLKHAEIREFGLSSSDLRRGVPPGVRDWPLCERLRVLLTPLLARAGFEERAMVSVRESRNPAGFALTVTNESLPEPPPRRRPVRPKRAEL